MPTHLRAWAGLIALLGLSLAAQAASAAVINWSVPQYETGTNADLYAKGTLFAAVTLGPLTIVNTVDFGGRSTAANNPDVLFGSEPISITGLQTAYTTSYSTAPPGFSGQYLSLVGGGGYAATTAPAPVITISDLRIGTNYTIEIFEAAWEVNYNTVFTGGGRSSAPVANSGYLLTPLATPQFILGSFTASATTQTITMSSSTGYVIFDAMQVRTELPEPASTALVAAALLGGALLRRGGYRARTLTPIR